MATILLVDNQVLTRRTLSLMLRRDNHKIVTAQNTPAALQSLNAEPVDLVITGEHNSSRFVQKVRSQAQFHGMPILILGESLNENVRTVTNLQGANGFLKEQTSSWELREMIAYHLDPPTQRPLSS